MTAERVVAVAFLVISVASMIWYGITLYRLAGNADLLTQSTPTYRGLLRTAICRLFVAVLYVGVGVNALFAHRHVLVVTFGVFCTTQLVWQLNAYADLRLSRHLTGGV